MKKFLKIVKVTFYVIIAFVAVLAFLYFYTSGRWEVAETVAQDSTISHITIDDVVFHSETFGSDTSQTLIIIHGGPGQDYKYLLPLQELSDQYRVVFYDQRGTGLSPRVDPAELTLQNSIDDLDRIINYYSPGEKVSLIGHSWGAMLGSAYLAQHPRRVDRIVLVEPGFLTTEMSEIFSERTNNFKVDMNFTNLLLMGKIVLRGLHLRGPDDQAIKDYIYSNMVNADMEDHPMSGYFCGNSFDPLRIPIWRYSMEAAQSIPKSQMDEHGNMQIDLVSGVEQYPDTVCIISGSCNRLIGPDHQKMQLKYFPRHRFEIIENAGHVMFIDQPETFFKVVRDYLGSGS